MTAHFKLLRLPAKLDRHPAFIAGSFTLSSRPIRILTLLRLPALVAGSLFLLCALAFAGMT